MTADITIAGMTLYQICIYFVLYSFIGWVIEVIFHAVTLGKVINRGFLNGPVCPVYGFGMLAVLATAGGLKDVLGATSVDTVGFGWLFLGGVVLATLVELIAGYLLDHFFHARWWDYSDKPFNFHGYICLEFSLLWGLGCVIAVRLAHPLLSATTDAKIPTKIGWPILGALYALYLVDLITSVLTVRGLNAKLKELDEVRRLLRTPSDALTREIAGTTLKAAQRVDENRVQASLARAELEQRAELLRLEIQSHRVFGTGRLLQAFPRLEHHQYRDALREIQERGRERLQERRENRKETA